MIHAILKPYVEYINSTMNGLLKETNKIKKMFPYKVRVQCPCCSKIIQGINQNIKVCPNCNYNFNTP